MFEPGRKKAIYSAFLAAVLLVCALAGCASPGSAEHPADSPTPIGAVTLPPAETSSETQPPAEPPSGTELPAEHTAPAEESTPAEERVPPEMVDDAPAPPEAAVTPTPEAPAPAPAEESAEPPPEESSAVIPAEEETQLEEEAVALSEAPAAVPTTVSAEASGTLRKENSSAVIDYSNTSEGYVMAMYTAQTSQRLKAQIKGPTTTYTYNMTAGQWAAFPLSDGNGTYQITIYQNVADTKYAAVLSLTTTVALANEFEPFLHSNQYVDFDSAPKTVAKAAELTRGITDPLKKVEAVYDYVVQSLAYDKQLAATVTSGYLPVLDTVLERRQGICFDYAALMTGMLRSQGVPCKLVVGYAGSVYHAWISVWVDGSGWVDGVIWFNGSSWQRMDPTFASSADSSETILAYIGDGTNYSAKYFY